MLRQGYIETTMIWPRIYTLDVIFRTSASFCMVPTCGRSDVERTSTATHSSSTCVESTQPASSTTPGSQRLRKSPLQTKKARTHAPPFHSTGFDHHKRLLPPLIDSKTEAVHKKKTHDGPTAVLEETRQWHHVVSVRPPIIQDLLPAINVSVTTLSTPTQHSRKKCRDFMCLALCLVTLGERCYPAVERTSGKPPHHTSRTTHLTRVRTAPAHHIDDISPLWRVL